MRSPKMGYFYDVKADHTSPVLALEAPTGAPMEERLKDCLQQTHVKTLQSITALLEQRDEHLVSAMLEAMESYQQPQTMAEAELDIPLLKSLPIGSVAPAGNSGPPLTTERQHTVVPPCSTGDLISVYSNPDLSVPDCSSDQMSTQGDVNVPVTWRASMLGAATGVSRFFWIGLQSGTHEQHAGPISVRESFNQEGKNKSQNALHIL